MNEKMDTSAQEDLGDDFKKALDEGWLPIREVARQTGVNAVTLRAWERRYGLIVPQRTPKGHRLYSAEHVGQSRRCCRAAVSAFAGSSPSKSADNSSNERCSVPIRGQDGRRASVVA